MTELDQAGLADLDRFLDFAAGQFDLAMVRADTPRARGELQKWLHERVEELSVFDVDDLGISPLARLSDAGPLGDVLLLTGFEGQTDEVFRALNVQRDSLMEAAPVPWILLGDQQGLADLHQVAPDFCDFVSVHVTVAADAAGPLRARERAWSIIHAHSGVFAVDDVEARLGRARQLRQAGHLSQARELLEHWWIDVRRTDSPEPSTVARGLRYLGQVMAAQGDLVGARRLLEQSLATLPREGSSNEEYELAASLHELADILRFQADLPQALKLLDLSLAISEKLGNSEGQANALGNLGSCYWTLGETPKAIEFLERSLAISEKLGNIEAQASALGNLGLCYMRYDAAKTVELLERSLALSERLGHVEGQASALANLGLSYLELGNLPKAIELLERSASIGDKIGHIPLQALAWTNLGVCYEQLGQTATAIDYLARARELNRQMSLPDDHPHVMIVEDALAWLELVSRPLVIETYRSVVRPDASAEA